MQVSINRIKFNSHIYPRRKPSSALIDEYKDAMIGSAVFPPIKLDAETDELYDGYHRWKATLKAFEETGDDRFKMIDVDFVTPPEGVVKRLFALSLNTTHGSRPKPGEKEDAVIEQYKANPGMPIKRVAVLAGVSDPTARKYLKPLLAKFEDDRRSVILRLAGLGWTQEEIAGALERIWPGARGNSRVSVTEFLSKNESFHLSTKKELDRGLSIAEVARRYAMPEILVTAYGLDGLDDAERMRALNIKVQPYDVWTFHRSDDRFGAKHPGRIPGQLVAHTLYFFTKQGDTVVDPMAGSGTTSDVSLALGRQCYAYDIDMRHDRPDIIPNDIIQDGWPERTKKADLIFWDPPYFSKMDSANIGADGYIDGSISKLDKKAYLAFFAERFADLHDIVKPGTRFAFLMSDWDDHEHPGDGIYLWDYAMLLYDAGWNIVRHIQTPLGTQQVHPDIVNKFRASRRLARLERYLLVAVK
jgi:hypothetical protein